MKKTKWNYAVVQSIFGDLWIGKTKLKPVKDKIFADIRSAIYRAQILFENRHFDFDPDTTSDDENYDGDLECQYNDLEEMTEKTAEKINKGIEKFIV